ncbi:MAG: hypothetical protein JW819_10660 [Candidatus Krumholzibacteriota bacterium]|nr:hypothetical protein [Candidatus Krumholzibacteriota bacterium]
MKRYLPTPFALFLLAALARLAVALTLRPEPVSDFREFLDLARVLAGGGGFGLDGPSAYRLPLYPAFLAPWLRLGAGLPALWVLHALLGAALAPLAWLLALRLGGERRLAAAAGLAAALYPPAVLAAPLLAAEHLFAALLLAAWILAAGALRGGGPPAGTRRWHAALLGAGFCAGLAALTRGEGLFQLAVLAAGAAALTAGPRRARLRAAGLVLLPAFVLLAGWTARNDARLGRGAGISTSGGVNFLFAHNDEYYGLRALPDTPLAGLDERAAAREGWRLGLRHIGERPVSLLESAALGTARLLRPSQYALQWSLRGGANVPPVPREILRWLLYLSWPALVLLVLAAPWLAGARPGRLLAVPFLILAANWVCYALVFWAKPRYRYGAEILLLVPAAATILAVWAQLRAGNAHDAPHEPGPGG